MAFFGWLENFLTDTSSEIDAPLRQEVNKLSDSTKQQLDRFVRDKWEKTPRIAIIGKTGVGKSSTINALFRPNPLRPVGAIDPTTKEFEIVTIQLGERGHLDVIDCPGLGETVNADNLYIPRYREILPSCDVAVWVLRADERAYTMDQGFINTVVPENLRQKLVVGINFVDQLKPKQWINELGMSLPSPEQSSNIALKEEYVKKILTELSINPGFVIPYSAETGYRLYDLFEAMMSACPPKRRWVLNSRRYKA